MSEEMGAYYEINNTLSEMVSGFTDALTDYLANSITWSELNAQMIGMKEDALTSLHELVKEERGY